MAVALTQEDGRIRIEWLVRWYARLPSLPCLAAGLFFVVAATGIVKEDLFGIGNFREDWVGLLMCLVLALCAGLPGLVLATFRYFVELDRVLQQVIITRQFGPVKFSRLRSLSDFKFLSITDDRDDDCSLVMYDVNLCGGKGITPIMFTAFSKREEAASFAHELGSALKLPARDHVGTEPDADEDQ